MNEPKRKQQAVTVVGTEGVSSKHIVELKSLISQENDSFKRRGEEDGALLPKRLRLAPTAGKERVGDRKENPGIEQRRARDEAALSSSLSSSGRGAVMLSDEQKLALSRTMMEKKAARYARRLRGDDDDDGESTPNKRDECLVDFASKRMLALDTATLGLWEPKSAEPTSIYADPGGSKSERGTREGLDDLDRDDDYYYERVADREAQQNIEALKLVEEQTERDKEIARQKKKEKLKEKDKRLAKIQKLRMMNIQKK